MFSYVWTDNQWEVIKKPINYLLHLTASPHPSGNTTRLMQHLPCEVSQSFLHAHFSHAAQSKETECHQTAAFMYGLDNWCLKTILDIRKWYHNIFGFYSKEAANFATGNHTMSKYLYA